MEKMTLLKLMLMYAQIMANQNDGIYPYDLYGRKGPKFNPDYKVNSRFLLCLSNLVSSTL